MGRGGGCGVLCLLCRICVHSGCVVYVSGAPLVAMGLFAHHLSPPCSPYMYECTRAHTHTHARSPHSSQPSLCIQATHRHMVLMQHPPPPHTQAARLPAAQRSAVAGLAVECRNLLRWLSALAGDIFPRNEPGGLVLP